MIKNIYSNTDFISAAISLLAFIVSCVALYQTKKQHMDSYRAKIVFNIIQQEHRLYLTVENIGQTTAFDIEIALNCNIKSPVKNLHVIPPNTVFRYDLMGSAQISDYPELQVLQIDVKYRDIYRIASFWNEKSEFPILELLKYTCTWNEGQNCFDIHRL